MLWRNLIFSSLLVAKTFSAESDYNIVQSDGSFDFRYDNPDSFHESHGNRNNVVKGVFGGRNSGTGAIDSIEYTAGPRGFRPRGKNVIRKYDFGQTPRGPIGNKDDPYYDPYEDPSYNFQFNTPTYTRKEGANRLGDVKGTYSFIDDVGERHDVEYIAGKNTGFHVKTPHPDSNLNVFRAQYFKDPRKPYLRGRSFVQRGLDGSYRFAHVGPDQRRTETSDAVGNVRGSYTYKDEKGVQHSVHYIAGPNIGYRVLKNVKGPHLPTIYPFNSQDIIPPDFYDNKEADLEVFTEAASSYTPPPSRDGDFYPDNTNQVDISQSTKRPGVGGTLPPSVDEEEVLFADFFSNGKPGGRPSTSRPGGGRPTTSRPGGGRPTTSRPGGGRPTTSRPISGRPTTSGPGFGRPSTSKPSFGRPTTTIKPGFGGTSTERPGSTGTSTLRPDYSVSGRPTTTGRPSLGFSETGRPDLDEEAAFEAGFGSVTGRPSFSTARPDGGTSVGLPSTRKPPTTFRPFPSTSIKPTTFAPGTKPPIFGGRPQPRPTTSRPFGRPRPTINGGLGIAGDEEGEEDIFGAPKKPKPSLPISRPSPFPSSTTISVSSGRPQPTSPTYSQPSLSPSYPGLPSTQPTSPGEEKPVLQFDLTEIEKGKFHTLVTNLGDTLFTVPPGVSVRAHVQNIDLIPLYARSPSPSEQYNAEIHEDEQQNAETSNAPVTVVKSTLKTISTTTPLPPTSKTKTTTKNLSSVTSEKIEEKDDDDDDDIDIF